MRWCTKIKIHPCAARRAATWACKAAQEPTSVYNSTVEFWASLLTGPSARKGNEMPLLEDDLRALTLLDELEQNPDITQASLAARLGVAVGTVNWHIKRLVAKGYLKVKRLERKKLRYIITPEGLALRTRLAMDYVQHSFELYRKIRARVKEQLTEVRQAGFDRVRILGEGDVAEICALTCLEQGIAVVNDPQAPALRIEGHKIRLEMEQWKDQKDTL